MKTKVAAGLTVFLWFVCAFHVVVGLGVNLSDEFPQAMARYYGAQISWTPEFAYIVKPLGAFMIALGFMAGMAARDPFGHPEIVYGFVLLFAMRGLQRLAFQGEIETALNIASTRNMGNAVAFLLLATVLFVLYRAARRSP
ncbi:MAG: hypothetical protein KJO31_06605 [Gammaproteobacteria bacterium]|nr:hypothetical protein [Gammaproteobacteria bacterium]